jgi:hypothetical protein
VEIVAVVAVLALVLVAVAFVNNRRGPTGG